MMEKPAADRYHGHLDVPARGEAGRVGAAPDQDGLRLYRVHTDRFKELSGPEIGGARPALRTPRKRLGVLLCLYLKILQGLVRGGVWPPR